MTKAIRQTFHSIFALVYYTTIISGSDSLSIQKMSFNAAPTSPAGLPGGQIPLHPQFPPEQQPVYNGVNPNYPGVHMVCNNPPMFAVENFLNPEECQFLIAAADDSWTPAPVVGAGSGEISAARTSSTCYLAREDVPNLMRKVSALTGKNIEHCELPQVGRYFSSQEYHQVSPCCAYFVSF